MSKKVLAALDWVIIAIYFVICLSIGIFSKIRRRKNTVEEFFLGGRSMIWLTVGCSLYASNMGSEHFIGLAGSGASTGIAVVAYEWHASWVLLLLGYFFVPIYIRSDIYTMPEYLKCRFQSKWMRIYLTVVCLISYITTKVAVDIFAGGLFLKEAVDFNIYISSVVLLSFTAAYTLLGGLSAVMYTDFIQCTIMIFGSVALSIIGFNKVGGFGELWEKYPLAVGESVTSANLTSNVFMKEASAFSTMIYNNTLNTTCYNVQEKWDHIFRPLDDAEFPWIGVVFSLPITGIWYWCTDQVIVQRTLCAKSLAHARAGTIFAGFLKILPLFIMIMPGMVARVLFPDIIACPDYDSCKAKCGNELGCSNLAYPQLVLNILPSGFVGLMLSVMIAALMSSMSSAFNSASTIFTMDIWKVIRPKAHDRELLWVGRIVIVILAVIGIAWIPIVQSGGKGQLFTYLQTVQSYLAPPTCAVFLVAMLWPKLTEAGALSSMLLGLLLAIIRLAVDIIYIPPKCGDVDNRPGFAKLHFMYFSLILLFLSITVMCVVSLFTRPVPIEMLGRLTWKTIDEPKYVVSEEEKVHTDRDNFKMESIISNPHPDELCGSSNHNITVKSFEEQSKLQKWLVWAASGTMLIVLFSMWVYFG